MQGIYFCNNLENGDVMEIFLYANDSLFQLFIP